MVSEPTDGAESDAESDAVPTGVNNLDGLRLRGATGAFRASTPGPNEQPVGEALLAAAGALCAGASSSTDACGLKLKPVLDVRLPAGKEFARRSCFFCWSSRGSPSET